jgi:peroxiredoxin
MAAETSVCEFGWKAVDFDLPGVDGRRYDLAAGRGKQGLLVVFLSNHCPYVKAVRPRLVRDCAELAQHGIGTIAINSNDPTDYPEDSFENMKRVAAEHHFAFPCAFDATQEVARAYGAVCTPDFFGFNAALELQYRGRLDATRLSPVPDARRELFEAMVEVARTGRGPAEQIASIGCSIKWKRAA